MPCRRQCRTGDVGVTRHLLVVCEPFKTVFDQEAGRSVLIPRLMLGTHIRYTRPTDPPSPVAAKRGAQLASCKYGRCQPMTLLRDGAPCCSQRPAPRSLRPWPMILGREVIWLPQERPNSSTSSDVMVPQGVSLRRLSWGSSP